jgi:2-dehydro-3-deoxyphosphogluconate aldolase/(4S)-4-hydroxy-2-oxoglutarate aldolase
MTDLMSRQRVCPVLRSPDVADAIATARAARDAGMAAVELTMTTPDVLAAVEALVADGLVVGVGTIERPEDATAALAAGASFIVSYGLPEGFVAEAHARDRLALPGAFTPTEIAACRDAGAKLVKLFPARSLGTGYLSDIAPVFPRLRFVATGGIAADDRSVREWLDAGALAVGLGSSLGTAGTVGEDEVRRRCEAALGKHGAGADNPKGDRHLRPR